MELLNIKNKEAIDFINTNGIILTYFVSNNNRTVTLKHNGIELGYFSIQGRLNIDTLDMSIFINDDPILRGHGLAKLMIAYLVMYMMTSEHILKDQLIYIDADASGGFWDHIGMSENRYYTRNYRTVIGRGYEKEITFSKLSLWAVGVPMGY